MNDQWPGPPHINFCQPIYMCNPGKFRSLVLNLLPQALILLFYERNAITRAGFIIWHSPRAPRSAGKFFFVLHLYLAERCGENPQSAKGPQQYNLAQK